MSYYYFVGFNNTYSPNNTYLNMKLMPLVLYTSKITNGTITQSSGYNVYTFSNTGTASLDLTVYSSITVYYLAVGGGGSGFGDGGGGGGGGAVTYGNFSLSSTTSLNISVGRGGVYYSGNGENGAPSTITYYNTITAGGGYSFTGGGGNNSTANPTTISTAYGGSGCGAGQGGAGAGSITVTKQANTYFNIGGKSALGTTGTGNSGYSGGGGGAGGAGTDSTSTSGPGGTGGAGILYSSLPGYTAAIDSIVTGKYLGAGGGGGSNGPGGSSGAGGAGGGNAGTVYGGGGGGGGGFGGSGGNGYKGIIVLAIVSQPITTVSLQSAVPNLVFDFDSTVNVSSSGTTVIGWTDSRMGVNTTLQATKPTITANIFGTKPGISFGQYIKTSSITPSTCSRLTLFIVAKSPSSAYFTTDGTWAVNPCSIHFFTTQLSLNGSAAGNDYGITSPSTTFCILTVWITGASSTTYRINGVTTNTVAMGPNTYQINISSMDLGGWSGGYTAGGYYGEFLLFSRDLTQKEVDNVEQHLSYKWGIGIGPTPTIASSSPYY